MARSDEHVDVDSVRIAAGAGAGEGVALRAPSGGDGVEAADAGSLRYDIEREYTKRTSEITTKAWQIILRAANNAPEPCDPIVRWDIQGHALLDVDGVYCDIDCLHIKEMKPPYTSVEQKFADLFRIRGLPGRQYVNDYMASKRRGSIINLQRELDMHLRLVARSIYKCNDLAIDDVPCQESVVRCYESMDHDIHAFFRNLVLKYYDQESGGFNVDAINMALDLKRDELLERYESFLLQHLFASNRGLTMPAMDQLDHALQSTSAISGEYLHTDLINRQAICIGASELTAHDKALGGAHVALRSIRRLDLISYSQTGHAYGFVFRPSSGVEARVPSLAVLKADSSTVDRERTVNDVVAKLKYAFMQLQLHGRNTMIYNLLTSLHSSSVYDMLDNHQTKSAELILEATHRFNAAYMTAGHQVLLQNIPINLHTDKLSLSSSSDTIIDVTLMTQLSLIDTLRQHKGLLNKAERDNINMLHAVSQRAYTEFLSTRKPNQSFASFPYGRALVVKLKTWQTLRTIHDRSTVSVVIANTDTEDDSATTTLAPMKKLVTLSLYRLFVSGLYAEPRFGTLVQSLSIYMQDVSLYGCKSANERFQMVAGRVGMLSAVALKFDRPPFGLTTRAEPALIDKLTNFVNSPLGFYLSAVDQEAHLVEAAQALQAALDGVYNHQGLHAGNVVSEMDQGGGSKVEQQCFEGIVRNTNCAEQGVSAWHQSKASPCQAHKSVKRLYRIAKAAGYVERRGVRRAVIVRAPGSMFVSKVDRDTADPPMSEEKPCDHSEYRSSRY